MEAWAPTEARNSEEILGVIEESESWIDDQEEWDESGTEGVWCTSSDSSSIVCPEGTRRIFVHRNPFCATRFSRTFLYPSRPHLQTSPLNWHLTGHNFVKETQTPSIEGEAG